MSKIFFTLIFALVCFSASAQNPSTGKASITPEMVETLVKMDQKRFNLTPEQIVQDRKVITDYQAKSNAITKTNYLSVDQLKAAVKKSSLELLQGYRSFLTPEQYNRYLATYYKLHPNGQVQ